MKSKKEIENICSNIVDSESINDQHKQSVYEGCVLGYTKCQEDIRELLFEIKNNWKGDKLIGGTYEKICNSLNKQE